VEDALATATSRFAVVVTFLAILELWHRRRIVVVQEQLFGPIEITLAPPSAEDAEAATPTDSVFDTVTQPF
jgi:chromatin segregation and condensation protein Rec8/ScpA/Scc1 (kleisin family)